MTRKPIQNLKDEAFLARTRKAIAALDAEPSISVVDLYDYVNGKYQGLEQEIERRLAEDATLYEQYCGLLELQAKVMIPQLKQAATEEELLMRTDVDHSIEISALNADGLPNQVYVIVRLIDKSLWDEGDDISVHVNLGRQHQMCIFRNLVEGESQVVLDVDHKFLALLANEDSQIYII